MDESDSRNFEEMVQALKEHIPVRRAATVDTRGNIGISAGKQEETIHISLNHVMEYYIYAYYFKPKQEVVCSDKPFGQYFREYGDLCMKQERYKAAEAAYKDAICWNPVDLDAILGLAECYKYQNMLQKYLLVTKQAYRYCCTRATMARYYRNMGYYCMAKYQVDAARVCYLYSNIYYRTDNADRELDYLRQALNDETPQYEIRRMQEILEEHEIEPGPDPDTIGIVYRVGELMMEDREYQLAKDCFSIVYDITREKALEDLLDELQKV